MSYKKLQIWVLAREVVIEVHEMTLKLPKFELTIELFGRSQNSQDKL